MKFNIGKFNLADNQKIYGGASFGLTANVKEYEVERRASAKAALALKTNEPFPTREVQGSATTAMRMNAAGEPTRCKYAPPSERGGMKLKARGIANQLGVDVLHLVLNLQPGESIELNMCELTAEINNENAMMFLANDGDFFDFLSGNNEVTYDITPPTATVSVETRWKDRWL